MSANPLSLLCAAALTLAPTGGLLRAQSPGAAPTETLFSTLARDLPIPPDARELEYDATFDDVELTFRYGDAKIELTLYQYLPQQGRGRPGDRRSGLGRDERPSRADQAHLLAIREGEYRGILVMPTGGLMPLQMY